MTKRRTSTTKAATTMSGTDPVLSPRALNRATLARQLLLRRSPLSVPEAVTHLVGLQGQEVRPPYYALAARLDGFTPEALSEPLGDRSLVRMVTMRSTIHLHTAADGLTLRPLVQPAREREIGYFRKGLVGVDLDRLATLARDLVEDEPRTMKQLREALKERFVLARVFHCSSGGGPLRVSCGSRCFLWQVRRMTVFKGPFRALRSCLIPTRPRSSRFAPCSGPAAIGTTETCLASSGRIRVTCPMPVGICWNQL
ncbi:hypothetical protein RKD41_005676 [Streptomyces tendae]